MELRYKVRHSRRCGIEIYDVVINSRLISTHFSVEHATTRLRQELRRLGVKC
jgi:hypothetical protein